MYVSKNAEVSLFGCKFILYRGFTVTDKFLECIYLFIEEC